MVSLLLSVTSFSTGMQLNPSQCDLREVWWGLLEKVFFANKRIFMGRNAPVLHWITSVGDIWNCCSHLHSSWERQAVDGSVEIGEAIFVDLVLSLVGVVRHSLSQCFSGYESHKALYDADFTYKLPSARRSKLYLIFYRWVTWDQMKLSDWPGGFKPRFPTYRVNAVSL